VEVRELRSGKGVGIVRRAGDTAKDERGDQQKVVVMKRKGFTLVEMLVVVGIIMVLVGLLSPMVMRAWRAGDRSRTINDLRVIATGLDAYRADHGTYPEVAAPPPSVDINWNGARMLCRALLSPGPGTGVPASAPDGAGARKDPNDVNETVPAPGFRLRGVQGKVYGPYVPIDTFKTGNPASPGNPNLPGYWAIMDRYGSPFLYYPATGRSSGTDAYVGDYPTGTPPTVNRPMFNARDNAGAMTLPKLKKLMGDANGDGKFTAPDAPAYVGDYVLVSAGPDEAFGTADDITNFHN
jgi:prepilin-type N-terminal cleavage/methylation domain-containing protein